MSLSDPIGSTAADVLARNAQDIDRVVNGGATVTTRTGRQIMSIDQALLSLGTEPPVTFASGISVTRATQAVIYSGLLYHARPDAIPFTTTGTFNAAQWTLREITTADLASTATGKGTALVGYIRQEAGAIAGTAKTALDLQPPSIMQFIPSAEHAAIYAKTSTFDCSPYFQALIDLGKSFTVPVGAKFRCNSALTWKSGAKLLCDGQEYVIGASDAYRTTLEFDSTLTTSGIKFNAASGQAIKDWMIRGVVIQGIGASRFVNFAGIRVENGAGYGAMQFNLDRVTISHCRTAIYLDDAFFSGRIDRLFVTYCTYGFRKSTTDFITSLYGDIGFFHVFFPVELNNVTYASLSLFFDHCGLQSDAMTQPADVSGVMPTLLYANNVMGLTIPSFGAENSQAMLMNVENYSNISIGSMSYWQPTNMIWATVVTRVANVAINEQALFRLSNSQVHCAGLRMLWWTSSGYPAASTSTPDYFCQLLGGDGSNLSFVGSSIAAQSYCAHPTGQTGLSIPRLQNGKCDFGAKNITPFNNYFDYSRGYLAVGDATSPTATAHTIVGPAAYVEGTTALLMRGAPGASSIVVKAVNGANGNSSNCALQVPLATSNNRSINAGGTVNASGADYAEYERNGGLTIAKGQIVGFRADGLLTLTYSEAVRFGVKSTSPSYVGGDTWQTAKEPADDATEEERQAFLARLEIDRRGVDRIAYSGKVPCNVCSAQPGDYIVAEVAADGSIIGVPVADPDLSQYRRAVGRVNRLLPDGRCEIAVIVH